jgi:sec-independent protein translocase protein TatA
MPDLGVPELLIIAFVVVLLFGSKKLPDAARSVGRSLRIFKAETKGLREDDAAAPHEIASSVPAAPLPAPAPVTPTPLPAEAERR